MLSGTAVTIDVLSKKTDYWPLMGVVAETELQQNIKFPDTKHDLTT